MKTIPVFRHLEDAQLVDEMDRLAQTGRDNTVDLIAALEELDRRQLCLPAGYRSMYAYCTRRLLLGEGAAYACIEAARTSRRFPVILDKLADGSITLATIGLIARHLTASNHVSLLEEVRHKSKREVERILAGLKPKPDVATLIRKMPRPSVATVSSRAQQALLARVAPAPPMVVIGAEPSDVVTALLLEPPTTERYVLSAAPRQPRPVIAALTPERFKLQITMDRETHDTLREIQDLMRHSVPNGDAAVIVARALKVLREQLLRQKAAQVKRPRARRAEVDSQPELAHSSDPGAPAEDFSLPLPLG